MTSGAARSARLRVVAERFGGVLSRELLRQLGVDRNVVARQVAAGLWRTHGRMTVALHTGPLGPLALRWRAVWEVGSTHAALDGVSSLQAAGLTGFDQVVVDVSVPTGISGRRVEGVRVHRVIRQRGEVVGPGLPRVATPLAAVRAAHWASSDRQAALLLVLPVQQRLTVPTRMVAATRVDRVRGRLTLVRRVLDDVADGAHSLGELDFARMCRRRGLPAPDRQVLVRLASGRIYLDVRWAGSGLVVEIDGAGHREGLAVVDDSFRQNSVSLEGDVVLRYPLLSLRLDENAVMDQVCRAHEVLSARHRAA